MHPEQTVSINKGSMTKKMTLHFQHTSPTQANLLVLETKKVTVRIFDPAYELFISLFVQFLITAC